jgi:hypothetical protein
MRKRRIGGIVAAGVMAIALVAPATADTGLIQILSSPRLKPARKISYVAECTSDCSLIGKLTLKLKHGKLGPVTIGPGTFAAGDGGKFFLILNKAAKHDLKANPGKARLKTTTNATNLDPAGGGATDEVKATFKFHKK